MARVGSKFTVHSHLTVGAAVQTSVRIGASDAEHLIEVRNHTTIDYEVDVWGSIQGGTHRLNCRPGSTPDWASLKTLVPMTDKASPAQALEITGPAGSDALICSGFSYRLPGAAGSGTYSNPAVLARIQILK